MSELFRNIQVMNRTLRTFVTNPLVHIHQKEKVALEIAGEIANVNKSLSSHFMTGVYGT